MNKKILYFTISGIFLSVFNALPSYGQSQKIMDPKQACPDCKIQVISAKDKAKKASWKEGVIKVNENGQQEWDVNPEEDPAIVRQRELKLKKQKELAEKRRLEKLRKEKELAEQKRLMKEQEERRKLAQQAKLKREAELKKKRAQQRKLAALKKKKESKNKKQEIRKKIIAMNSGWIASVGYSAIGKLQGTNTSVGYFAKKWSVEAVLHYNTEMVNPYNAHWNGLGVSGKYYFNHQGYTDYFSKFNYYVGAEIGMASSDETFGSPYNPYVGLGGGVSYPIYNRIRVFGEINGYIQDDGYKGESLTIGVKIRF